MSGIFGRNLNSARSNLIGPRDENLWCSGQRGAIVGGWSERPIRGGLTSIAVTIQDEVPAEGSLNGHFFRDVRWGRFRATFRRCRNLARAVLRRWLGLQSLRALLVDEGAAGALRRL